MIILILAQIFEIHIESVIFRFTAEWALRQSSANIVVKCFACVNENQRDWLSSAKRNFPSSKKQHDEAY